MAQNFITASRHGTIYYFRRRVPDDLRQIIGKPYLVKTLKTSDHREATILARAYAGKTDEIYQHLRAMKMKEPESFELDYTLMIELGDLGKPCKVTVQGEPHETEAIKSTLETALQFLPSQVGEPLKPQLSTAITTEALLDDFFREGIGANRWKNPDTARKHDYDPVWKKFSVHANKHGLTLAAAKAFRVEVLAQDSAQATKNRDFSHVHAVLSHGVDQHDLDGRILRHLKMPTSSRQKKGGSTTIYLPFSDDELALLFHSDAYRDNTFKKPSHYWMPLLGLYTGARLEELAGLHLSAFITLDKIPAVLLSDEETTDGGKNEHALRQVPIHKELIQAGLLLYVQQLRSEGHTRLFPEIGEAARDGFGKRASVDFTDYRRSVGVGKKSGERSRQVFHSFRSTLAGKFYLHGVDGDMSRRLSGHAGIDVHQKTYLGAAPIPMKRAAEAMDLISFNLSHPPFKDSALFIKSRKRAKHAQLASQRAKLKSV